MVDGVFDGYRPHARICSNLTHVGIGGKWGYVCPPIGLRGREIVGHAAGGRKDSRLVKSAFATFGLQILGIEVFHADKRSDLDSSQIDEMLEVFGVRRSLSGKGCPCDNAVDEPSSKTLERGVYLS